MSKKNFKGFDNPALAFISQAGAVEQETPKEVSVIAPEMLEPKLTENRTKRVQLVLTPTMFEETQIVAKVKKQSVNSLISDLLSKEISKNKEKIEIYKKCFSEFEKNL